MKRFLTAATIGLAGFTAIGTAIAVDSRGGPLIVHEWGTFTNFAGSDGVQRSFASPIGLGADLPSFVRHFTEGGGSGEQEAIASYKSELICKQRMETPVIYFYPGCTSQVDVEATLLDGTMTEFYPPVNATVGPGAPAGAPGKADHSTLRWQNVRFASQAPETKPDLPTAGEEVGVGGSQSHYFRARATDAAILNIDALGTQHHEKFLFYRGAANFDSRIVLKAVGNDRFEVSNSTGEPVAASFIVRIGPGSVRWSPVKEFGATGKATLTSETSSVGSLAAAVRTALVSAGLYEKEAAAMVETWRDLWFGEQGTRLLYIMPRAEVERVLPLKITPAPNDLKRVFVGRSDVLTPEDETAIGALLAKLDDTTGAEHDRLWDQLPKLGRFTPLAVERVRELQASGHAAPAKPAELGWGK